jgi:amino acid adenylation domain-containing protein
MSSQTVIYSERPTPVASEPPTLVELLRERALRQAEQRAYIFLSDGETAEESITYGELDCRARAVAARLQSLGAAGERVLLLYAPGLDYIAAFFGCLYAGAIAVPAYPPRQNRNLLRLQTVVADSGAAFALTTEHIFSRINRHFSEAVNLGSLHWLITDEPDEGFEGTWQHPSVDGDTLAFLQYTSGSTAASKGVMVSHRNILHNERMIQRAFGQDENSITVGWLPLYHDMGLIGNVLQPLYTGTPCVLMSPVAFLQRPMRWLQAISKYRATTSGGPNFAYELCVSKISPEQRAALDLSSWSVAYNGAEPIRAETLDRFSSAFAASGFRREAFSPCYGLAEATLLVSVGEKTAPPVVKAFQSEALERNRVRIASNEDACSRSLVGCGRTGAVEQSVVIVNPSTLIECAPDEVGEVWLAGPSVTGGYWHHPIETEPAFGAYMTDTGRGPFLRTGDLGFILDGELFITGRLKDLIIIRGLNHYPQDIELTAEKCHTSLRPGCGAAFSVEVEGEEQLVIVQEALSTREHDLPAVIEKIRETVAEQHEVRAHGVVLIKSGSIPKTTSGKIQRRACREKFLNGSLEVVEQWQAAEASQGRDASATAADAPHDPEAVEGWLQSLFASKVGVAPSEIDVNRPLSQYGLDSLAAIELTHSIESALGVSLPLTTLLQGVSVSELALQLLAQQPATTQASDAAREGHAKAQAGDDAYPLSQGQQSLWFLQQLAADATAYHIARAVRIRSELDVEALRRALAELVRRHASLRTTFSELHGGPMQWVHEDAGCEFTHEDASGWSDERLKARLNVESHRGFDLEQGRLLRVNVFTRGTSEHVLLLAVHHIVVDLWSLVVMTRELGELYAAERDGREAALPPLTCNYTDYISHQAAMLASPKGERLWSFWQKQLAGELPVLNLPTDRTRPPIQTYRGAAESISLSAEVTRGLKRLGETCGATLYMSLLASFQALLYRYTGQRDLIVGSPVIGRSRAEWAGVVGYFVNMLAVRGELSGGLSFADLLRRTRRNVLEAFDHQEYPFAPLVERLQPERDPSRSPLFQAAFALQKASSLDEQGLTPFAVGREGGQMQWGGLTLESVSLEHRVSQFDLTLSVTEEAGELSGSFEYNTDLFDASTIRRMAAHWQQLLEGFTADPRQTLAQLPMLSEGERAQLLYEWNDTAAVYPRRACVQELFEQQAARVPERLAVANEGRSLSYEELNTRARQLANHLRGLGVGVETTVGVLMERSPDMLVALLGILKAGGAYLPLDPAYPAQRLAYMLDDAQVSVLLTRQNLSAGLTSSVTHTVCLDTDWPTIALQSASEPASGVGSDNLAYVIYTSGSTGTPKGVQITHGSLMNLVSWHRRVYQLNEDDRATLLAGVAFDASVWEVWPYLASGAAIHIPDEETRATPEKLRDWLVAQSITLCFVPTPTAESLLPLTWPKQSALRALLTGGDRLHTYPPDTLPFELVNHYGPTENTVVATCNVVPTDARQQKPPTIGRPISNTQVYILDEALGVVPVGVSGQLYLSGQSLARGYQGWPEQTAEKFIPNPFGDEPGTRLYRTGDLARYLPDGQIEYLGRADQQVKVRGFRIELGEIEAALAQHERVREAVVVAREDAAGHKRLVAYVVAEGGAAEGGVSVAELRGYLGERLPEYMVPSLFITLDELPLTPNGKVDRRALPAPELRPELSDTYVAAGTPAERVLADIWCKVLGLEQVGVHDNFFDLGGHSLLATQVISRVQEIFDVELPLSSLFATPTVDGLLDAVARYWEGREAVETIAQTFLDIEQLSEEEVQRMLLE